MQQILITTPYEVYAESAKINSLFEAGMEQIHIKKFVYTRKQTEKMILGINEEYRNRIVLHHNFDLAVLHGLQGIHIARNIIKNPLVKLFVFMLKFFFPKLEVSTTFCNSRSIKNIGLVDFAFVGPLYTKFSETNIKCNFNTFEMSTAVESCDIPLIGMGGIQKSNLSMVQNIGFTGIALKDSVWNEPNFMEAFQSYTRISKGEDNYSVPLAS